MICLTEYDTAEYSCAHSVIKQLFDKLQSPLQCLYRLLPLVDRDLNHDLRQRGHRYKRPTCSYNHYRKSFAVSSRFKFLVSSSSSSSSSSSWDLYTVSKTTAPFYFCNNFARQRSIFIILAHMYSDKFGTK